MNKLTSVQVQKLINSIKEKPFMYNTADKDYKEFTMKENIWKEIAKDVGVKETDCKIAWRSLRDQFVKATKNTQRRSGSKKRKTYKYYDKLLFLKETLHTKKRTSTCDHCTDESDTMDSDVAAILDISNEKSETVDHKPDLFDVMNEIACASAFGNKPTSKPISNYSAESSKKIKPYLKECDILKDILTGVLCAVKTSNSQPQPQGDNEQFFSTLSTMVKDANLTPFQTRQIHRKLFNLVADELDKIESNK